MLAQLFFTPSGIILEAVLAATLEVVTAAVVGVAPKLSCAGFAVSGLLSSTGLAVSKDESPVVVVSQADDSVAGTTLSLCDPLV